MTMRNQLAALNLLSHIRASGVIKCNCNTEKCSGTCTLARVNRVLDEPDMHVLPKPFKPILNTDAHEAIWNGEKYHVTMTELVITKYKPKSHTRDRLFVLTHHQRNFDRIFMTGDAYDNFVKVSQERIARGLLKMAKP